MCGLIQEPLSGFAREQAKEVLCRNGGGSRILASDETAVHDREWLPVGNLLEDGSQPQQFVLYQKRHNMGQLNFCFFAVGDRKSVV